MYDFDTYLEYVREKARNSGKAIIIAEQKERGNKTMEVTLNGVKMEGSLEQIATIARTLGVTLGNDGVFYMSNSRGLIRITDMTEQHLVRAIAKRTREWAAALDTSDSIKFVREVTNGTRDVTTLAMMNALTQLLARKPSTSSRWTR
jgi:hypothetical protein